MKNYLEYKDNKTVTNTNLKGYNTKHFIKTQKYITIIIIRYLTQFVG